MARSRLVSARPGPHKSRCAELATRRCGRLAAALAVLVLAVPCAPRAQTPARRERWDERSEQAPEFADARVRVLRAGSTTSPPLVLIHGAGPGLPDFDQMLAALSVRFRVLTFELPGFGTSTHRPDRYTPERYGRFVHGMLTREFGARPVALFGHSMGGALAGHVAGRYPASVSRLLLLDVAGLLHHRAYVRAVVADPLPHHAPWEKLLRAAQGVLLDVGAPLSGEAFRRVLPAQHGVLAGVLSTEQSALMSFIVHDFGPELRAIQAPTWIGWGVRDEVAPRRNAEALRALIPQARLELFSASAHAPMRSEPAAVVGAISRFLADETAPGRVEPAAPAAIASTRRGVCDRGVGQIFEGDFDTIELRHCAGARLDHVRARAVFIEHSTVEFTHVELTGSTVALSLKESRLRWTGGHARGATCIASDGSVLDLMAVDLACADAFSVYAPSQLLASMLQTGDAETPLAMHGEYKLARQRPGTLAALKPAVDATQSAMIDL
jgi:pimeloyl-ACP methyl ester carboxylesterase